MIFLQLACKCDAASSYKIFHKPQEGKLTAPQNKSQRQQGSEIETHCSYTGNFVHRESLMKGRDFRAARGCIQLVLEQNELWQTGAATPPIGNG